MTTHKKRTWLIAGGMILAAATVAFAAFFQGFEVNTDGWTGATRVMSLTHGVPSKSGAFHAEDQNGSGLTYTFWGGDSKTFPPGGYTTSVDIYLDISAPYMNVTGYANDTRFDWSSAIGTPGCDHRRDFVFNAGFYNDIDTTGAGPRFVISASTNATRSGAFPKNPGKDPFPINVEGWYTFEHRFYAVPPGPGGVLRVDLTIKNAAGLPLHTWTLSDPSDIIGTTVGGNQYGWFVINEFPYLGFDTSMLVGYQDFCAVPPSTSGAKVTAGGWITVLGGKGTFGLTAKANDTPSGNLTYQDHGVLARTVKSTAVTSVSLTGAGNCAQILGTATVNGTGPVGFQVDVCDNGEPGKDADTFSIVMGDGYSAAGTLGGGNVQIHK